MPATLPAEGAETDVQAEEYPWLCSLKTVAQLDPDFPSRHRCGVTILSGRIRSTCTINNRANLIVNLRSGKQGDGAGVGRPVQPGLPQRDGGGHGHVLLSTGQIKAHHFQLMLVGKT